ncbi:MAG TPA: DUF2203 domain-containing protein [Bryobacteraceae bacterium]|jgi:hypothetical protein|nr:DUF2203 domain-containing protein [Bryobacteraceae bacterium]
MSKRFTLRDAQRLLPEVERLLTEAMRLKPDLDESIAAVKQMKERVHMQGGMLIDRTAALEMRQRRETASKLLRKAVEEILELGVQIKDIDIGLVDFPTRFHGREVYLCWKLGENDIEYWHGEEGFRGRKPIDRDFLDNHGE